MTPWTWWAGEIDDDTYGLAEAATREEAIREASQGLKPGDKFRIVEARASTAARHEGSDCVPFLRTRNHEIITVGPVEVSPSPKPQEMGPAFWAVHSASGIHIGLWPDKAHAEEALREYEGGTLTPLYRSPKRATEVQP